jgi:hypothetical protein
MMGGHHAVTGAAVWLALTAPATVVPTSGLLGMSPGDAALGAVLVAGTALGPDLDHMQATAAHSAGVVSKVGTAVVGAASGGHRHGTHAPLVAAAVLAGALWLTQTGWAPSERFDSSWWACAAVICASMAFAVKALRLARRWPLAWLIGAATAAGVCLAWPAFLTHLPLIVAVGWCTHLAGDLLTTGGLPLAWPFRLPGPAFVPDAIWKRNGYFALPALGNAGSKREWVLCSAVSVYVLLAMWASIDALLPR